MWQERMQLIVREEWELKKEFITQTLTNQGFLSFSTNVHSSELQTPDARSHTHARIHLSMEVTHWLTVLPGDSRRDTGGAGRDLRRGTERIQAAVTEGIHGLSWPRGNGRGYIGRDGVKSWRAWCWTSHCWRPAGGRGWCRRSALGGGATQDRERRHLELKQKFMKDHTLKGIVHPKILLLFTHLHRSKSLYKTYFWKRLRLRPKSHTSWPFYLVWMLGLTK